MSEIELMMDGRKLIGKTGQTILQVAKENGIKIPTLCYHPRLILSGACRVCVVEVEGAPYLAAACAMPISKGMNVRTSSERAVKARRMVVELLLANHKLDCLTCESNGRCELQDLAYELDIERDKIPFPLSEIKRTVDESSPVIIRDQNKCILCGRCIRACQEVRKEWVIGYGKRGFNLTIASGVDEPLSESDCTSCGECVQVCPTGALTEKPSRFKGQFWKTEKVTTICPYCGVGCTIDLYVKDNSVIRVMGNEDGPENKGSLCVKGRFAYDFVNSKERLVAPLIRKNGEFVKATWNEALNYVASRFKELKARYGTDSIAGLASAKCTNEENYLFQKLVRTCFGTNNVDHCARLCHASSVAGLAAAFGSGAMTNSIKELLNANVIFVTGSNTTEQHPIIGMYIKQAVVDNGCKIIVADPREIELVKYATLWLRQKNGTDVALINGITNVILSENLQDETFIQSRTENFDVFKKVIEKYTPEYVEKITTVPAEKIREAARLFAKADKASIVFSMGITQHITGTDNVMSLANLAMLTGNVGKESTGVNPLRGQNNVQGACDMGALSNFYPGYVRMNNDAGIKKLEDAWGTSLPRVLGLTVVEMMNVASEGKLKGLYIMGENPMISDPNLNHVKEALEKLEFLVVQDIFMTETAQLADVILPAASYAEKDGTFTNTARRIQRLKVALKPPGEAKPDWQILVELSKLLGYEEKYSSPSEIMDEIAKVTSIYGGVNYHRLDEQSLQWPCPNENHPGTPYLHKEQFTRGKGLFNPVEFKPPAEVPDEQYPFILTTGRILQQFHTGTMTRKSEGIEKLAPECRVEINPMDADNLGVKNGDKVIVSSRRGKIIARAEVTERSKKGMIFIPFHYREAAANILTNDALDPVAKIPEFKVAAVNIQKAPEDKVI